MNRDIKIKIFSAGLRQWQIAAKLNMDEGLFSKKINREELTQEFKEKIEKIIEELSKEENYARKYNI